MYEDGYKSIINIDLSEVAIKIMKEKYSILEKLIWEVGDITSLKYKDEEFDLVLDKGINKLIILGVLDSILFRNKEKQSTEIVKKMIKEILRVLKPDGNYIIITMRRKLPIENDLLKNFKIFEKIKININSKVSVKTTEHNKNILSRVFIYKLKKLI
jgi:ubiquinone/menaquinone biosynthesis C-methylase UbiE